MNGRKTSRFLSKKHFGGSRPGKSLMRPNVRVIEKPGHEPSLEVFLKKGPEVAKAQRVFELFPESFDDGNGAGLTDSAESLPYSEAGEKLPKSGVDVLAALVGYSDIGITDLMPSPGLCRLDVAQNRRRCSSPSCSRHNQSPSRKASSLSAGRYRAGLSPRGVVRESAFSFKLRSA